MGLEEGINGVVDEGGVEGLRREVLSVGMILARVLQREHSALLGDSRYMMGLGSERRGVSASPLCPQCERIINPLDA